MSKTGFSQMIFQHASAGSRGAALLLVLGAVVLLGAALLRLSNFLSIDIRLAVAERQDLEARLQSETGIALARHPGVSSYARLLDSRKPGSVTSFRVRVTSEESRLNINRLVQEKNDPGLVRLFRLWGLDQERAEQIRARWMDWVDADDLKRLDGAEKNDYARSGRPDFPLNRPFQSMDEVREALGGSTWLDQAKPDWFDFFSVHGHGRLDLREAPAEAIAALAGVALGQAEAFVRARRGPDGKDGTADDSEWQHLDQALAALGVAPREAKLVEPFFSLGGSLLRITSTGQAGRRTITTTVITLKGSPTGQDVARWEAIGQ